jgi:hypothetical protein
VAEDRPDAIFVVYLNHRYRRLPSPRYVEFHRLRRWRNGPTVRELCYILRGYRQFSEDLRATERSRLIEIFSRLRRGWIDSAEAEWFRTVELIPIIPSRDIGGFLIGTLNFTQKTVRELIELGYRDTLMQLRETRVT